MRDFQQGSKGCDQPGLLAIGLNPKIRQASKVEDKELGALLLGVGGNEFPGGSNTSSFRGWAVIAVAEISVDGTPVLRGGRLL